MRRRDNPKAGFYPLKEAAELLGCTHYIAANLVGLGILEGEKANGAVSAVRVPEGETLVTLTRKFFDNPGQCVTVEDFERFRLLARRLLKPPRLPDSIIEDAFDFLERNRIIPTSQAFCQLVGFTAVARPIFQEQAKARGLNCRYAPGTRFRFKKGDNEELAVLARVDPIVQTLPGTHFDPKARGLEKRPHPKFFSLLNLLTDDTLLTSMTMFTYWYIQQNRDPIMLGTALTATRRLCAAAGGLNLRDPDHVREALLLALGPGWKTGHHLGWREIGTAWTYFWIHEKFNEFLSDLDISGRAPDFARFRPVLPRGYAELRKAVNAAYSRERAQWAHNKQVRIEKILDNPDAFQLVGRTRLEEHQHLLACVDKEIDRILASGQMPSGPVPISIPYETRLINEGFQRVRQSAHVELYTWDYLLRELAIKTKQDARTTSRWDVRNNTPTSGRAAFAIRWIGVTPDIPNGKVQIPIVVEATLGNLFSNSVELDAEQMQARFEAKSRLNLHTTLVGKLPGVPYFHKAPARVARAAQKYLSTTLLPLREFALALHIAQTASCVLLDTGARYHELVQIQLGPGKLRERFDEKLNLTIWSFDAIAKGEFTPREYHVLDSTMTLLMEMWEKLSDYWHDGGAIPVVTPGVSCQHLKKLPPAQYIFHAPGRILTHQSLCLFLRFLYLGWHGVKPHDFRHLFNSLAKRGRLSAAERMQIMNHKCVAVNEAYGQDTPSQRAAESAQHAAFLLERELKLRERLHAADRPLAEQTAYELRRESALLEFHSKEGDLDAIERSRSEIKELSLRLAEAEATTDSAGGEP
ncbi:MAG TPA: hypothetical protein VF680_07500 [Allosphingosinicella sp.]|jgi:integrase